MKRSLLCSVNPDVINRDQFMAVKAIKAVRFVTNWGLKESKDFIDNIKDRNGGSEILHINNDISRREMQECVQELKDAGMTVSVTNINTPIRRDIAKELNKIISMAILSSQYDISKELILVAEMLLPEVSDDE